MVFWGLLRGFLKRSKKVREFISKFRRDPTSNGLNYEKIHDARSNNVHSVRIDQTYRGSS